MSFQIPPWRLDLNNHRNNTEIYEWDDYYTRRTRNIRGRDKTNHLIAILDRLQKQQRDKKEGRSIQVPARTSFERKMIYKFCEETGYSFSKKIDATHYVCKHCKQVAETRYSSSADVELGYYRCDYCQKFTKVDYYQDEESICNMFSFGKVGRRYNPNRVQHYVFTLTPPKANWKKSIVRVPLVDLNIPPAVIINHIYSYLPDAMHV